MKRTSTRPRGKPRQLPLNARRVTVGKLSQEHIVLLQQLGKGNLTQGIRELCELFASKQSAIANS